MNVRNATIGKKVKKTMGIELDGIIIERFNWVESNDGTYKAPGMRDIPVRWSDGTKGYIDAAILQESD